MKYYHAETGGNGIALPIIILEGGGWSKPQPSHLTPRKRESLPTIELGGTHGRCAQVKKISPHWGSNISKIIVSYITVF